MDHQTAADIIACLPRDRTLFHYYRDRYSIGLLRQLARVPLSVAELKRTPFASLAQKPRVKMVLAQFGRDRLTEMHFALHDYDPAQTPFILTLDLWGSDLKRQARYKQTTRLGYNLVLQLNFCKRHDQLYRGLGEECDVFNDRGHPTSKRRNTLAWARIDLDFDSGTALIEEIQSDWIRDVAWLASAAERKFAGRPDPDQITRLWGLTCPLRTTLDYCRYVLDRYQPIWAEATLWAALHFLRDELGLRRIYYHTMESGQVLKKIDGSLPPSSLYTDLPRRFCFGKTDQPPAFVAQDRHADAVLKKHPRLPFHRIDIA